MKRALGSLIALLLLGVLVWAVWSQRAEIVRVLQLVRPAQLALVLVVMLPLYPLSVLAWHQLLLGVGGKLTYREALGVWMLSNVARLLPGTIWQWVGRVYLAGEYGVTKLQASVSVAYEIATLVVSAALVGAVTLPWWPVSIDLPWWLSFLAVIPLGFLWPTTLPWLVGLYGRIRKQPLADIPQMPLGRLVQAVGANVLHFGINGVAIWLLMSLFVSQSPMLIVAHAGMYAAAWLLGYVTIVAPGGLGVADASLAGLLAARATVAIGSLVALLYRVLLLINELLITALAITLNPSIVAKARQK